MEANLNKDIGLLTKLLKHEIIATVKAIDMCKLCKSCAKITFSFPVATLIEEIYTEYELSGMNAPSMGMKSPFMKQPDTSRPIRSANRFQESTSKTKEPPNDRESRKPPPSPMDAKADESPHERSEASAKENLFNINKNAAYMKTPHILRSRANKRSLNHGDTMENNSDILNRERSTENVKERANSQQRPFTRQVPPTSSNQRHSSEKPAEERMSQSDILRKQLILKVNSIKDQRFKELDTNSAVFERRTRDLIAKVIDCKYWIPITFLLRLTYDQIEKNFPLEDAIDKNLSNVDLPLFMEELKVASESGKNLFSKSP